MNDRLSHQLSGIDAQMGRVDDARRTYVQSQDKKAACCQAAFLLIG